MSDSSTVVIAVDGSKNSESAFEYYCKRLHRPENKVVILHAAEEPNVQAQSYHWAPTTVTTDSYQKLLDEQAKGIKTLESKFSSLSQRFNVPSKVETVHCQRAADCIVSFSQKNHADSIIMGSRGQGTLRRTFMGSVSDYVLHHSNRPVTVIPPQ